MKVQKVLVLDQKSKSMVQLANKNQTTEGICGFITCAVVQYIAQNGFDPARIKQINEQTLTPYIEKAMKGVLARRRMEIRKFNIMAVPQRLAYLKNQVCNFEVADYLESVVEGFKNKQVYFFRQSSFNYPKMVKQLEYEQAARIEEEQPFGKDLYFYSSFGPYGNHFTEEFIEQLRRCDRSQPVLVATDILGHFYTSVLFGNQIYILDSLDSYMQIKYDSPIVGCIEYLYRESCKIESKE